YSEEDYLWTHSVNVCIFSVLAGLGLGYDALRLEEVGLAGILHDAGMIKTAHIIQQPQKLTEEEYEQLKEKPFYGAEILDKVHDLDQSVIYIAREHHCYRDIKELPRNEETQNARLNEYTRITRLADIYDVMTHPRSGNEGLSSENIVPADQEQGPDFFETPIVKILLNQINLYTENSRVELSTSQVGKVTQGNERFPLRPVVQILFDSRGRELVEPGLIDLNKQLNIYIAGSADLQRQDSPEQDNREFSEEQPLTKQADQISDLPVEDTTPAEETAVLQEEAGPLEQLLNEKMDTTDDIPEDIEDSPGREAQTEGVAESPAPETLSEEDQVSVQGQEAPLEAPLSPKQELLSESKPPLESEPSSENDKTDWQTRMDEVLSEDEPGEKESLIPDPGKKQKSKKPVVIAGVTAAVILGLVLIKPISNIFKKDKQVSNVNKIKQEQTESARKKTAVKKQVKQTQLAKAPGIKQQAGSGQEKKQKQQTVEQAADERVRTMDIAGADIEDNLLRDPFMPYTPKSSGSALSMRNEGGNPLELRGILKRRDYKVAIINDYIVKIGDIVEGQIVSNITNNSVTLKTEDGVHVLELAQ
ncbi:MAG: HD domain-containing protein, partial [Candidatus Omnitrophica bacterium]|nr:HD domain-containing protein [Candidatus Omnitrophota bacterium]